MAESEAAATRKLAAPPPAATVNAPERTECERTGGRGRADRARWRRGRDNGRIYIGAAFPRWRELRRLRGFKSDPDFATYLLTRCERETSTPTPLTSRAPRSSPRTRVSKAASHSLSERDEFPMEAVEEQNDRALSAIAQVEVSLDWEDKAPGLDEDVKYLSPLEEDAAEEPARDPGGDDPDHPSGIRVSKKETSISAARKSEAPSPSPPPAPTSLAGSQASPEGTGWEDEKIDPDEDLPSSEEEDAAEEPDSDVDSDDPDYIPGNCVQKWRTRRERKEACVRELKVSFLQQTQSSGAVESLGKLTPVDEPRHKPSEQHQDRTSNEEPKERQEPRRTKKSYDCPTCGRVCPDNSALKRHLVIHSGNRPFKCFICGRGFTQSGNLKTHMKVHKGESSKWTLVQEKKEPPRESPEMMHVCGECGMDFPEKHLLEEHRASHKKPYACPECSKTFKNKDYLKVHERVHSGEAQFVCPECGKSFLTAVILKKHKLTHTGEKNFRCEQCGRAFSQASNLNGHIRTHSGERPHLCAICGKSYSRAGALKVHLRVHTGERPYICDKCGKCFYYFQGYRAHVMIHDKKPKPPTKPLGRPKLQTGEK